MSSRAKAFLALLLAPPILTELASGNTPAHAFLNPRIALFLILAYSFPLLIIRELSLRWRLSTAGVFLLGLAYGIVNEGLLAQTLIRYEHVPIDKFDHYLFAGGFNLSWACIIVPWHALFAVLFPLALLAFWFPGSAQETWLSNRAFQFLSAVLIALMAFISFVRPPHPQMLACLLGIAVLAVGASLFRDGAPLPPRESSRRFTPFLFGLLSYPVFFLGSIILAARRAPALLFFLFIFLALIAIAKICEGNGFLLSPASAYLALGAYVSISLFHLFAGIAHRALEEILTGLALAATFLFFARPGRHALPAAAEQGGT